MCVSIYIYVYILCECFLVLTLHDTNVLGDISVNISVYMLFPIMNEIRLLDYLAKVVSFQSPLPRVFTLVETFHLEEHFLFKYLRSYEAINLLTVNSC